MSKFSNFRFVLIVFLFAINSCNYFQNEKSEEVTKVTKETKEALSQEQQKAFDSLNFIQMNTDNSNQLYSTFPNIDHNCSHTDSIFNISQAEFLEAMNQFISKHCTQLSTEERQYLASTSVLAQDNYTISYCPNNFSPNYKNGIPSKGKWIIPNILYRRDLIINW